MHKYTVLMLVTCLVASSLVVYAVVPVFAQAGYKPSVPQFSVKVIDKTYRGTDTVDRSMDVTIKNQHFTPYIDVNGDTYNLYYTVQYRTEFSPEQDRGWGDVYYEPFPQTDSQYTTIRDVLHLDKSVFGSRMEFRVKAEIGCLKHGYNTDGYIILWTEFELVSSSGWSGIQTATATDDPGSPSPSQTATWPSITSGGDDQTQYPSQTQPPYSIFTNPLFTLVIGVILGGIVVAVVMAFLKRHIKTPTYTNDSTQTNTLEVRCRYA